MATTKAIREALRNVLQPTLGDQVGTWHLVDGFVPARKGQTGSVGSGSTTWEQQDNEWDLASTDLPVYIATVNPDPEAAEAVVQDLGELARQALVADNPTLGGVVGQINVTRMDFTTAEADGGLLVHFITLQVSCSHMVPRFRTPTQPPADELVVEVSP